MSDHDHTTTDNIGREVRVKEHTFGETRKTVYGDGSTSSSTGLHLC